MIDATNLSDAFVLHKTVQHEHYGVVEHEHNSNESPSWKSAPIDPNHARLIQSLFANPDDESVLVEAAAAARADIEAFTTAASALLPKKYTWKNYIGNQIAHPKSIQYPTSLDELIATVKLGREQSLKVRAVGSGHSYSCVALTTGILLLPHKMAKVLPIDASVLRDPSRAATMFVAESGITIKRLNIELDSRGLALLNMGAYDGQTLAGAISTGTHGSGAGLGPICSSVLSLTLVSAAGDLYHIEPTNGITDPAKFRAKY